MTTIFLLNKYQDVAKGGEGGEGWCSRENVTPLLPFEKLYLIIIKILMVILIMIMTLKQIMK